VELRCEVVFIEQGVATPYSPDSDLQIPADAAAAPEFADLKSLLRHPGLCYKNQYH